MAIDKRIRSRHIVLGDLDKPFHQPQCECNKCEQWRMDNDRQTYKWMREDDETRRGD